MKNVIKTILIAMMLVLVTALFASCIVYQPSENSEGVCTHEGMEEVILGKDATCTEAGLTDGKKCSACGEITVAQEEIPAQHAWVTDQENGNRKCSTCSFMEVSSYEGLVVAINADETFVLTADIALPDKFATLCAGTRSGSSYTGEAFSGSIDGANHKITNLTATLIGVIDGATVKNLKVEANINAEGDSVASIAGIMVSGLIDGVEVSGTVVGNKAVGGIVGRILAQGTVENCTNNAAVTSTGSSDAAGGIVGKAYYTAEGKEMNLLRCINNGVITGNYAAGGIVGFSAANLIGCENSAVVNGGVTAGGIVGEQTNYGEISGNKSVSNITASAETGNAGGIIGWVRYQNAASNYPVNEIISVVNNTVEGSIKGLYTAGGIIGLAYNQAIVTGNSYTGTFVEGGVFAAGVVGGLQNENNNLIIEAEVRFTITGNTVSVETITANCTDNFAYNNDPSNPAFAKVEDNTKL